MRRLAAALSVVLALLLGGAVPFPDVDMPMTVRAAFGADLTADPSTWSWTDLSSRLINETISKRTGRQPGATSSDPSSVTITLDNDDGALTPLNAESAYYPNVILGLPIEISINPTGTPTVWASGYADSWQPDYIPTTDGTMRAVVRVTASGSLRRLAQGGVFRSAMYRSMIGTTPGDYTPHAYWAMEDGADSTVFANAVPGPAGQTQKWSGTQTVQLAADDTMPGSEPVPNFPPDTLVDVRLPTYTDTGQWVIQAAMRLTESTSIGGLFIYVPGIIIFLDYDNNSLNVGASNAASGASIFTNTDSLAAADVVDRWVSVIVASTDTPGGDSFVARLIDDQGNTIAETTNTNPGVYGIVQRIQMGSGVAAIGAGHLALFTDPAFDPATDGIEGARAISGWTGEMAHERAERLAREERVPITITGSSSVTMGPQTTGTLLENLQECEGVGGFLGEDGFGLHYICQGERYNRGVDLAVDLSTYKTTAGTSGQVLRPVFDDQLYRNRWTVNRPEGSEFIADVSDGGLLYEDSATANVETDEQLPDQASWRASRDSIVANRYAATPIDLAANTGLIDDWLTVVPGLGRVNRTGLAAQYAAGGDDRMVTGWSESLGRRSWTVNYDGELTEAYQVGEWDDTTAARLDTAGSVLHTAVNNTATSFDVATTSGPLWTTDNAADGWDWWIGGERVTVTDVAASTITYGAVGTVSHASNASVTPGLPGSLAQGNLMVMLAAIRNSGAGVPNTPSGWTRWPVFQSTDNVQVFAKIAGASESGPTVTFSGGVANADTTAQIIRLAGNWHSADFALLAKASCLNTSAQDITYPGLPKPKANDCLILYVGWKQDDWTSVASPGTEIAEPDTTTGDDQGIVWAYQIQTTRTAIASGTFTVTGGASAISRGAVLAIRCDRQTATVTRSVNSVVKSHSADAEIRLWRAMRVAL